MYLSGPPLHVLAMALVRRFRETLRRPLPDLVLGRHRSQQLRRRRGARPRPGHRVHRSAADGRLRRACGLLRRARQAHGRASGARDVDEWVLLGQGHADGRSRPSLPRTDDATRRCVSRTRSTQKSDLARSRRAGAVRRAGSSEARAAQRAAVRGGACSMTPRYAARRAHASAAKGRLATRALRLPHLRQVRPGLPERRELHLRAAAHEIPVRQAAGRATAAVGRARTRARFASRRSTRSPTSPTSATSAATATSSAPRTAVRTWSSRASSAAKRPSNVSLRTTDSSSRAARVATRSSVASEARCSDSRSTAIELASRAPDSTCGSCPRSRRPRSKGAPTRGAVVDLTYFRIMDELRRAVLDGPGVNYVNA